MRKAGRPGRKRKHAQVSARGARRGQRAAPLPMGSPPRGLAALALGLRLPACRGPVPPPCAEESPRAAQRPEGSVSPPSPRPPPAPPALAALGVRHGCGRGPAVHLSPCSPPASSRCRAALGWPPGLAAAAAITRGAWPRGAQLPAGFPGSHGVGDAPCHHPTCPNPAAAGQGCPHVPAGAVPALLPHGSGLVELLAQGKAQGSASGWCRRGGGAQAAAGPCGAPLLGPLMQQEPWKWWLCPHEWWHRDTWACAVPVGTAGERAVADLVLGREGTGRAVPVTGCLPPWFSAWGGGRRSPGGHNPTGKAHGPPGVGLVARGSGEPPRSARMAAVGSVGTVRAPGHQQGWVLSLHAQHPVPVPAPPWELGGGTQSPCRAARGWNPAVLWGAHGDTQGRGAFAAERTFFCKGFAAVKSFCSALGHVQGLRGAALASPGGTMCGAGAVRGGQRGRGPQRRL